MLGPRGLARRAALVRAVRRFFEGRGYIEVDTPQLLPRRIPEPGIAPPRAGDMWLQASPELCMKRLLARGCDRIFQVCHVFRSGEQGRLHLPEFTMLEWYRRGWDYGDLMGECEELICFLGQELGQERIRRQGRDCALVAPFTRLGVDEAFVRWGGMTPEEALERGRYDQIMVEEIEPRLGRERPCFLYGYPAARASLARLRPDDPGRAERFELYIAGVELANGFSELCDSREQRRRLEEAALPGEPLPEAFLHDLDLIGAAAGMALGLDRLAMLFFGGKGIDEVVSMTAEEAR